MRGTKRKNGQERGWIFWLLCGLQLLLSSAFAAEQVLDASQLDNTQVSLTPYFAVLEDASLTLTLADVQKPAIAASFKTDTPAAEALGFGYTRSAYWLRLHLSNPGDRPLERMLEISYARLSSVQFHQADLHGAYQSVTTGNILPGSTRAYKNRNFVFPVKLPAHSEQVVYLRLQSTAEDKAHCLEAGMNDFLTKPIYPDVLYATLLRWLDQQPRQKR